MNHDDTQLSDAVATGNWNKARHLAAIRVAQAMEKTESPREIKALSISLVDLLQTCEDSDVTDSYEDTPFARIMRKYDESFGHPQQSRYDREVAQQERTIMPLSESIAN